MKLIKTKYTGVFYYETKKNNIYNKPVKIYYIKYYINGKQKQECIGSTIEGITEKYAAGIRQERLKEPFIKSKNTFGYLFKMFILWSKNNKKTWKDDLGRYNKHLKEIFENKIADDITTQDINNLILSIKIKGKDDGTEYAPQTIKHILLLIKRVFNYAINNGIINKNPTNNVKISMPDNTRISYLYPDEIERMFIYLNLGKEWSVDVAFIKFAFYTGLRRSELFNLLWSNIDIKNSRITLYNTKGGRNETIQLTEFAIDILKNLNNTDSIYVFPSKTGGRREDIKRLWNRIKKEANIRSHIRFHDIRHTFGTIATSIIPIKVVQKMMTHKDIKTTLRYAHIQEKELIDAASTLNNIFNKITK